MTECEAVRRLLALRPADWNAEERRRVQAHVQTCASCIALALVHAEQDRVLEAGPRAGLTPAQRRQLLTLLPQVRDRHHRRQRLRVPLAVAGGLVGLVALIAAVSLLWRRFGWGATTGTTGETPSPVASPTAPPGETAAPIAASPSALPSAVPTSAEQRSLTVCLGAEPDTLYIHGGAMYVAGVILEAIYDGPFDQLGYTFQPVILEKLPSLADGDAVIETVLVSEGDSIVDSAGDPQELRPGVVVQPAGCHEAACAVPYEGGQIEMEQMVVTFRLKENLAWADGRPLTADDSVYSYELYWDPEQHCNFYRPEGNPTARYEALDGRTVVWTGLPGYRDPDYATRFWQPLPRHILGHLSASEVCEADEAARLPLGYGAFTTREWVPGRHLIVERNPYYFRADEGLPYFDRVVFRFLGQDPEVAIASLLEGQCDILTMDILLQDEIERLLELDAAGQLRLYAATTNVSERLDFGIDPAADYGGTQPDFFEDVRMRQAIAYCLDRQGVVEQLLYGLSVVPDTYVPPNHPLADPDVRQYPYDPEQGMALLDELGWRDEDGDGVRECHACVIAADGTPLAFNWGSSEAALRSSAMALFQADLRRCGFDVTLLNLPAAEWFADPPEGPLFGRRFDLSASGVFVETVPACWPHLCSEIPSEENGWVGMNWGGYCSAEYDQACRAALQTLPGTSEYAPSHQEAQRIFAEELPALPLFLRLRVFAARPDLYGLVADPTEISETWNIEEFSLEP